MAIDVKKDWSRAMSLVGFLVVVSLGSLIVIWQAYELVYNKTVLPRVMVSGIELSNLTPTQMDNVLRAAYSKEPTRVVVTKNDEIIDTLDEVVFEPDFQWAVQQAWSVGRSGNALTRLKERIRIFSTPANLPLPVKYDEAILEDKIALIEERLNVPGKPARVSLLEGETVVETGTDGFKVNKEEFRNRLMAAISSFGETRVEAPIEVISNQIENEKLGVVVSAINDWKGRSLKLNYKDKSILLNQEQIANLLSLGQDKYDENEWNSFFEQIQAKIETLAKDAVFRFENGKVTEFQAEAEGVVIDKNAFEEKLYTALTQTKPEVLEIPVKVEEPKIKAAEINNLGIKTLIGVGNSEFHGSIPNRIHNLTLAASRVNGRVVAPGEIFSFNEAVGDISRSTGYKEAYVIKEGRTVLGDGGGVCQVSTTLFRAIMNAGLPIEERKAHAYRVHYYEEDMGPGFDATVFSPSTDLKFKNDTPGHILIQTQVDAKNLTMRFELFGSDDGRVATVSAAKIYSQTPPPAPLYQDDPTLKTGVIKQIDWAAWGAKTSFDYKVNKADGTVYEKTFYSNYRPWQAVYLRGTGV